jgi:hypothetical protein
MFDSSDDAGSAPARPGGGGTDCLLLLSTSLLKKIYFCFHITVGAGRQAGGKKSGASDSQAC